MKIISEGRELRLRAAKAGKAPALPCGSRPHRLRGATQRCSVLGAPGAELGTQSCRCLASDQTFTETMPFSEPSRSLGLVMSAHRNLTGPKSGVNSAESEGAAINRANGTGDWKWILKAVRSKQDLCHAMAALSSEPRG